MRSRLGVLAGLVLLFMPLACGSPPNPLHLAGPPARILMIQASILRAVLARDNQVAHTFAGRTTYAVAGGEPRPVLPRPAGRVEPTAIYTSYAAFAQDLADGRVPRADNAVLFDIEKWPATPPAEQRNPQFYMEKFSGLARAHGLFPILAPARDLVLARGAFCWKRQGENLNQAFIRCGLAGADRGAGALVVQSQVAESNAAAFRAFVSAAARQARAGNPRIVVLAQLSTAPLGHVVGLSRLVAAARAVRGVVQGYSVNARFADLAGTASLLLSFRQA